MTRFMMSASELIRASRVNPVRIGASRGGEEMGGAEKGPSEDLAPKLGPFDGGSAG
jgi:hypothetical protein